MRRRGRGEKGRVRGRVMVEKMLDKMGIDTQPDSISITSYPSVKNQ